MSTKQLVRELTAQGWSAPQIQNELHLSKSTVHYHLHDSSQEKTTQRQKRRRIKRPALKKLENFLYAKKPEISPSKRSAHRVLQDKILKFQKRVRIIHGGYDKTLQITFTHDELMKVLAVNPVCYLTGRTIDLNKPTTYAFDHIIPTTKNGPNTLDNLGLACKIANSAKTDMTVDEHIHYCAEVLMNFGFKEGNLKEWLDRQASNLHLSR